ncbi:MAG: NUDIX domain-containing protein [Oscillospiraceae bacterium]|nr:NUDIX domain-containing protein [Oscillospiraceae bacterium]MBQ3049530.1 NUDIX domain-containing protein [Oscillospiraceae bacterium]MBQ9939834.1 NUDIX domain-containing protein [Oscillospiraceae bacterium]
MSYIRDIRSKIGHDELIGVGAGVFIYKGSKVLLQRRKDNLCWSMHAGGLEIGESVEDAAKRELFEETGLTANNMELLGVFSGDGMRYTYPNGDKVCIVQIIYVCDDFSGDETAAPDEIITLKWFDIHHLPTEISPPDKKAFDAFVKFINSRQCNNK